MNMSYRIPTNIPTLVVKKTGHAHSDAEYIIIAIFLALCACVIFVKCIFVPPENAREPVHNDQP